MNKHQNAIPKMHAALENCRNNGILVISGLMLSPLVDDLAYIRSIPQCLRESGLHVPLLICSESPIPGTPYFHRLAARSPTPFLPGALLRDFTGYTLVLKPSSASIAEFTSADPDVRRGELLRNRMAKLADDLPRFVRRRLWFPGLVDIADALSNSPRPALQRTLVAGSDTPPPERVPFASNDFATEAERRAILEPWRVTDEEGRVLDYWLEAQPIFGRRTARTPRVSRNEPSHEQEPFHGLAASS